MALWPPDILAEVSLLPSNSGGRKGPTPAEWFGCPMQVDGTYFDARIDLSEIGSLSPGQTVRAPLRFLSPENALPLFSIGKSFALWEGRVIGSATVLAVYPHQRLERP
jgi:hypothetical protein